MDALQSHRVLFAEVVILVYAAMLLVEGIGLWLELSWVANFTMASTSLLLRFEIYQLIERVSSLRAALLLLSVAIVGSLISRLTRHRIHARSYS